MSVSIGPGAEFGNYRFESLLGRGGMSVVYLAEDKRLGRRVAIKILAPELAADDSFRTRFIRESQLAAGLEHPNIVPVYEAGEIEEHLFIAMRYVRGTDLRTLISRDGKLEPDRTVELLRPVAGALDAAHRRGLVHRDVKPANILVAIDEGEEHPYLSDFGLTKHTSSKSGLTKTGQFMGTVDYVAPEQIKGDPIDGRTDQYSLACVIYQCLTGQVPFDKEADVATMFGHLQDPPPKVSARRSDLPDELDEIVARGMAKERDDRFPTSVALVDAVARTVGLPSGPRERPPLATTAAAAPSEAPSGPMLPAAPATPPVPAETGGPAIAPREPVVTGPQPSSPSRPPSPPNRRGLLLGGLAVLLVGVVVVGVVLLLGGGDGAPPSPTGATGNTGVTGVTGVVPPANVIFQDDFSDPASGWDVFQDNRSHGLYQDGEYVLGIKGGFKVAGDFNTSTQELSNLSDVRVEATARLLTEGARDALFGVVCRAPTPDVYYYFLIGGNGKFFIGENDQQGAHNLDIGVSPSIARGLAPNRIVAECVDGPEGVTLRMFVNGVAINTLIDSDQPIQTGSTGFLVESGQLPVEAAFDDYVVAPPQA